MKQKNCFAVKMEWVKIITPSAPHPNNNTSSHLEARRYVLVAALGQLVHPAADDDGYGDELAAAEDVLHRGGEGDAPAVDERDDGDGGGRGQLHDVGAGLAVGGKRLDGVLGKRHADDGQLWKRKGKGS